MLAYDPLEYTLVIFFLFGFLQYQLLFLFFHFLFCLLGSVSFLPGELGQRFVDFVYPFKTLVLGFTDF